MKTYILDAPLIPPKNTSDAKERLLTLAKACGEIIADGKVTPEEAGALRRWLVKEILAGKCNCSAN
jgi:hypothetical protein